MAEGDRALSPFMNKSRKQETLRLRGLAPQGSGVAFNPSTLEAEAEAEAGRFLS